MTIHDALIIGGGPAGATAGILLARAGWKTLVLEQSEFPRRKVCGEFISAPTLPLLHALGVAEGFHAMAGPEVNRIGLYNAETILETAMPPFKGSAPYGRALGRDRLDDMLLKAAAQAGAEIAQPWKALRLVRQGDRLVCTARQANNKASSDFHARIVIAAHGSWEPGELPSQPAHRATLPGDLFGFKAHFRNASLQRGLMPLLVFQGGYGGMVETDDGRVSLSCCIRQDRLAAIRQPGMSAGEAVLDYIRSTCRGVREVLDGASLDQSWLASGPIRPGIRRSPMPDVYLVGNAAGEAHPIIADGISIAMQSSWLLCRNLLEDIRMAEHYDQAWRRQFRARIVASSLFAQLAIRPWVTAMLHPAFRQMPSLLGAGAWLAGKTMRLS